MKKFLYGLIIAGLITIVTIGGYLIYNSYLKSDEVQDNTPKIVLSETEIVI